MQVVLLERVDRLGKIGDVVEVRPGYARNFLIPRGKALRATENNIAYFEQKRAEIEAKNDERKGDALKTSKKLEGKSVLVVRQASEKGHLYGSVSRKDVAQLLTERFTPVSAEYVVIHRPIKTIGLHEVIIALHADVKLPIQLSIAQSEEEAQRFLDDQVKEAKKEQERAEKEAAKPKKKKDDAEVDADVAETTEESLGEEKPKKKKEKVAEESAAE